MAAASVSRTRFKNQPKHKQLFDSVRGGEDMTAFSRVKEHCLLHNRSLDAVLEEALSFWLDVIGETTTEELLESELRRLKGAS